MNTTLSLLGTAMLILLGLAVVLAVIILILYEARWIVRLARQLLRSAAAEEVGSRQGAFNDKRGGT